MADEVRVVIKLPSKKKVGYEVEQGDDGFFYGRSQAKTFVSTSLFMVLDSLIRLFLLSGQ